MKKNNSRHPLTALSLKLGAKQSELLQLLEISRPLLHGISTGKRPISGRTLRKIELFAQADASLEKQKTPKKPIAAKECNHKASVIDKKIYDVTDKLAVLQRMEEAIEYVSQITGKFPVKSKEHDWCTLHLRRLKQRLPKQPDLQRAEWEAKLAGLHAEKKFWEKKAL
jgi:transcriptional regulator with XRE-family HTH domain